ncbi:MAG: hypothetical protein LBM63_02415 [Rikenellaceae bacterium]|nr:hypothetical protein [Rikenellaceae bacterium]
MSSLRMLKKDIDYLVDEVVTDAYLSLYFHPERRDEIVKIMEDTVALRNTLIDSANHPVEKHNASLVRKHYSQLRRDMFSGIDSLFVRLSETSK